MKYLFLLLFLFLPLRVEGGMIIGSGAASSTFFLQDSFTELDGTNLSSHTGEVGATWTKHSFYGGDMFFLSNNLYPYTYALYYASGTPTNANYKITATIYVASLSGDISIAGRVSTTNNTYYMLTYAGYGWQLQKKVDGVLTSLGTRYDQTLVVGNTYIAEFILNGTSLEAKIDGVSRTTATDSSITAAGLVGITGGSGTSTTSYHITSITAENI